MSQMKCWIRLFLCALAVGLPLCPTGLLLISAQEQDPPADTTPNTPAATEKPATETPATETPAAETPAAAPAPVSADEGNAGNDSSDTEEQSSKTESTLPKWDRLIYIPFRELQKVFDQQKATVVIPYEQYMELMKHYLSAQQTLNGRSPDAVITETDWSATIEKDIVRIQLQLKLNVLKNSGWSAIPLSFGSAAVGGVSTDVGNVLLQGVGPGKYQLLVEGAGLRTVTIDLLTTVRTSPENKSFQIECPPAGISHLTVTIPEADQTVTVSPVQVILPSEGEAPAATTVTRVGLGATESFEVQWHARAGSKPVMDLLASAVNTSETRIESGLLQTRTNIVYEILRGELREVSLLAPPDARIIDVVSTSGRLRSWKAEPVGDTHQLIRIELLSPVSDRFQVEVQTERNTEADTFQLTGRSDDNRVQAVHADAVVRESGRIIVSTDPSLTTIVKSQTGVRQVDAGAEGKGGSAENRQAWEFSGLTGKLVLQTKPVEPRLLVSHDAQLVFTDNELRLRSILNYTVERAGVFQLVLSVPASLTVDRVSADGMSEFNVDKDSGKITLSLTQKRMGAIAVTVQAHQSFNATADNAETEMPIVSPEGVERETGTINVYAPQFLDVSTIEEKLTGLFPVRNAKPAALSRLRHIASWSFTRRPVALFVRTSPRPAQIAATVGTTARVEPDIVKVGSVVSFDIQNAGIDTLRIAVPENVASDVRFTATSGGHHIQQRTKAEQAEDGFVTWTLVLQDEATGSVTIAVDWEITPAAEVSAAVDSAAPAVAAPAAAAPAAAAPAADTSAAAPASAEDGERSFLLQPPKVLPPFDADQSERRRVTLTQARGEMRLLRHESLSITATEQGESVESIDVRELELLPHDGYLAFRYYSQPASATVRIRKHEIHEVVATVVSRAALEVVTEKQELAAYRCRFRITSSERQRLRIDLPINSELQAPLLNGQRTTIERATDIPATEEREAYYVNISREQTSDQDFLLTIQFRCPIVATKLIPYERYGGLQLLRLPTIGEDNGSSVVQQTQLAVWAPKDVSFMGDPNRWTQTGRPDFKLMRPFDSPSSTAAASQLNEWTNDQSGSGDFATQGHVAVFRAVGRQNEIELKWRNRPFLFWIISGTLVILGLILKRTSWENRISITLLIALAVALWSLKDGYSTLQFITAGWPGVLVVAALWITGGLFGSQSSGPGSGGQYEARGQSGPPSPSGGTSGTSGVTADASGGDATETGASPPVGPSPEVTKWMNDLMGGK